jgi:hypothetical protein
METIELYQPANGTEGMRFRDVFCDNCIKCPSVDADNQCGIMMRTMLYGINDKEYPNQWRYVDGRPTCTAFKDRDEHNAERRAKRKVEAVASLDLFDKPTDIGGI